eukprot:TRINITY_DN2882_c0_g2_i6.p1 TRINITY_DN2882_c0_g2~~TRINITY_DN2882_c0_g2_i6.p1  ORF type:complete len:166 (+),score=51.73 TRINITY_DN2882_c0_g2_i6:221-718(+)
MVFALASNIADALSYLELLFVQKNKERSEYYAALFYFCGLCVSITTHIQSLIWNPAPISQQEKKNEKKTNEKKGGEKNGDEKKGNEKKGNEKKGNEKKGNEKKGDGKVEEGSITYKACIGIVKDLANMMTTVNAIFPGLNVDRRHTAGCGIIAGTIGLLQTARVL